jgi:hypothetical protein
VRDTEVFTFTNKPFCRLAALAAAAAALAGCSSNRGTVDTAHAATIQQSMDAVKTNPHIPDSAKAQIISQMQQQHGTGAQNQPH